MLNFRQPGTLEEAIAELRARYRRPLAPLNLDLPQPRPRPVDLDEEEEDQGILAKAGRATEWLKRRGDIAQTYYAGLVTGNQELVNRALSGEPAASACVSSRRCACSTESTFGRPRGDLGARTPCTGLIRRPQWRTSQR